MDNLHISVTSEGLPALRLVFQLLEEGRKRHFVGYRIDHYAKRLRAGGEFDEREGPKEGRRPTIFIYWMKPNSVVGLGGFVSFPFEADLDFVTGFVDLWLKGIDYGREPDHDGDNSRGFYAFNEAWGHVNGEDECCLAVQPAWAMHGK